MAARNSRSRTDRRRVETVIVGGGQAGLAVGYHLACLNRPFTILDSNERVGDAWRSRWESLRLFTPARYDGLPGMRFPASGNHFPTKDEMADYLEAYAAYFDLPVETGVRVDRLSQSENGYLLSADDRCYEANQVVVAMGSWQVPRVPDFAGQLDPEIFQLHSSRYRSPRQLKPGGVLVVGAGNSGAEIALETAREQNTWLAGRHVGEVPFRIDGAFGRHIGVPLVIGFLFHHVMTPHTPMGRKLHKKLLSQGGMLVRTKASDIVAAGVKRVPKVAGVSGGAPVLDDGTRLEVANVIWSTGFGPGFSWIDLPIFDGAGLPRHRRGVVESHPGLYFVGLPFIRAASSAMVRGVPRDAKFISEQVARRTAAAKERTSAKQLVGTAHG